MENAFTLNDLRTNTNSKAQEQITFETTVFGGYSKKAVTQYIKDFNDRLQRAEEIFNSRLEEYSQMTAMLSKEKEQYIKENSDNKKEIEALKVSIDSLKSENEQLQKTVCDASENALSEEEIKAYEAMLQENTELKEEIAKRKELPVGISEEEYNSLKLKMQQYMTETAKIVAEKEDALELSEKEKLELKSRIEEFQNTIADLQLHLNELKSMNEELSMLQSENDILKGKYDEAISEIAMVSAEKNLLSDQNNRLSSEVMQAYESLKGINDENTKLKLKMRRTLAEFEGKIYEASQNHKQNITEISRHINSVITLLSYESSDMVKLLDKAAEERQDQ